VGNYRQCTVSQFIDADAFNMTGEFVQAKTQLWPLPPLPVPQPYLPVPQPQLQPLPEVQIVPSVINGTIYIYGPSFLINTLNIQDSGTLVLVNCSLVCTGNLFVEGRVLLYGNSSLTVLGDLSLINSVLYFDGNATLESNGCANVSNSTFIVNITQPVDTNTQNKILMKVKCWNGYPDVKFGQIDSANPCFNANAEPRYDSTTLYIVITLSDNGDCQPGFKIQYIAIILVGVVIVAIILSVAVIVYKFKKKERKVLGILRAADNHLCTN